MQNVHMMSSIDADLHYDRERAAQTTGLEAALEAGLEASLGWGCCLGRWR